MPNVFTRRYWMQRGLVDERAVLSLPGFLMVFTWASAIYGGAASTNFTFALNDAAFFSGSLFNPEVALALGLERPWQRDSLYMRVVAEEGDELHINCEVDSIDVQLVGYALTEP